MRLQAELGVSVPTAILASETLHTVAFHDFEGHAWTDYPSRERLHHTHMSLLSQSRAQNLEFVVQIPSRPSSMPRPGGRICAIVL